MPPRELPHKLGRLRARLRSLILLAGLSRVTLVALGALAAALLLDWLAHLETPGRLVLLGLAAAAVGYTAWRHLVAPLRLRLGDQQLALILERRFPHLRDRLISTVQFAAAGDPAPLSRAMLGQLVRETAEHTAGLDFQAATRARPAAGWGLAAGLALVGACLYVLWFPATAAIFATRFFNPLSSLQWPRRTQLSVLAYDKDRHQLAVEGHRIYVPKGEDLHVVVRAARFSGKLWRPPARVAVHYRFAGGGSGRRFVPEEGPATYSTYFTTVTEGFSFHVTGDDATTPTYEVRVRNRPRIESIRVTLQAPAYTGEPERVLSDGRGSIAALAGSLATIEVTASKPIAPGPDSARILVNDRTAFPMSPVDGAPARRRGSFRLQPDHKHYAIALVDTDGLTNSPPPTYRLDVAPDRAPVVTLPEPGGSRKATPNATLPIRLVAKDDYAVARTRFLFRRGEKDKPVAHPFPAPPQRPREVEQTYQWALTPLAVQERETLEFYAEAEDTYAETRDGHTLGPNVGRSPTYLLTIISEAEMMSLLQRRLQEQKARLEKLVERQERAGHETGRLAQGEAPTEHRDLKLAEREQLRIAAAAADVAQKLDQTLADMTHNEVGNLEDRRRVESLAQALRPLAEQDMPEAARRIATAAQHANERPRQQEQLDRAAAEQRRIADDLRAALARFGQWSALDELVRDAAELLLQQKKLNERTTDLARQLFGKPAEALTADEKGAARSLAREQRAARDAMKALEDKMARTASQLQDSDPAAAKAVQQALSQANAEQIRGRMDQAATHVQQAKPASALPLQAQATEALQRLLDTLSRARTPYLARDLRQIQDTVARQLEDVKRLLDQQRRHLAETQVATLRRQLQGLRDQQAATRDATRQATSPQAVHKQAADQAKHTKDADQLGRQLERLAPPEEAHKDPLDKAAQELGNATGQMNKAAQQLAKTRPASAPEQVQAARQQADAAQTEALKHLDQADQQLAKLQKQLAQGRRAEQRLAERAREQDQTRKATARTAQDVQKTASEAKPILPRTAESIQKASQDAQQATQAMSQARERLREAAAKPAQSAPKQAQAQQDQQEAARNLENARDQLAKAQQELDLQRRQQEIFELEKVLAGMLLRQVGVRKKTEELYEATDAGREPFAHAQTLELHELTDTQGTLHQQCGDVVLRLEKQKVPVFHYVMTATARAMVEVQRLLSEKNVGWLTQETERDIERHLSQLLGALKQEAQRLAREQQQSPPGGAGGAQGKQRPEPLVPPLAQLKQLRTLQATVNEKTRALEVDRRTQALRRQRLFERRAERLARQQEELGEIARKFAEALEEQRTEEQMSPP